MKNTSTKIHGFRFNKIDHFYLGVKNDESPTKVYREF